MHLLVVFLIMNVQFMVVNRLKIIWNISGICGEITPWFNRCQYRSSVPEQIHGLHYYINIFKLHVSKICFKSVPLMKFGDDWVTPLLCIREFIG
jgi:hypothetical protein